MNAEGRFRTMWRAWRNSVSSPANKSNHKRCLTCMQTYSGSHPAEVEEPRDYNLHGRKDMGPHYLIQCQLRPVLSSKLGTLGTVVVSPQQISTLGRSTLRHYFSVRASQAVS